VSAVELVGVSKHYGPTVAVDTVSLEVREGELLALLGPSGCGKTTLLRMIAGFVAPTSGSIVIRGRDVGRLPPHQRDTGMVFQSYALFPHMTVAANVAFGLKMRGIGRAETEQRVNEALELVALPGYGQRYPGELSGGQQQRVALARALVIRPSVLLLDEPLSNLDARLRVETRREIRRLQQRLGLSAVFVTHDQEEALAIADRVAVLCNGKLEEIATPVELYERPRSRFAADFIGHTNVLRGEVSPAQTDAVGRPIFLSTGGLRMLLDPSETRRGPAELALRAARCRLSSGPPPEQAGGFAAPGVIEQVDYLGASTHYVVQVGGSQANGEVAGGERLLVEEANLNGPGWRSGDQVYVSAEAAAVTWVHGGTATEHAAA
jgi:putative spermidine/putrescine transport system ATP-binding protein